MIAHLLFDRELRRELRALLFRELRRARRAAIAKHLLSVELFFDVSFFFKCFCFLQTFKMHFTFLFAHASVV